MLSSLSREHRVGGPNGNLSQSVPGPPDNLWVKTVHVLRLGRKSQKHDKVKPPSPRSPGSRNSTTEPDSRSGGAGTTVAKQQATESPKASHLGNLGVSHAEASSNNSGSQTRPTPSSNLAATHLLATPGASQVDVKNDPASASQADHPDSIFDNGTTPAVPALSTGSKGKERAVSPIPVQRDTTQTSPSKQDPKEDIALKHASLALQRLMGHYDWMSAAMSIEMQDYKGSRRICVTCWGDAATKVDEIEAILTKQGKNLQGFAPLVKRIKGAKKLGFLGPDAYFNGIPSSSHGASGVYSNIPLWTSESAMIECLYSHVLQGSITGVPIRARVRQRDGHLGTFTWTCGGVVKVDGVNYGLTTAHPLVMSNNPRAVDLSQDDEGADSALPLVPVDDQPDKFWQPLGKASHYALTDTGFIPINNDWLIFSLPGDCILWNYFRASEGSMSSSSAVAVCTARGRLSAAVHGRTTFLLIGGSSFEVLKILLSRPLYPGDSGSWVVRGDRFIGVIIAGSDEDDDVYVGYAISAQHVCHNISLSMGDLSVRPLTQLENEILAHTATKGDGAPDILAALYARQMFSTTANVGDIKTPLIQSFSTPAEMRTRSGTADTLAAFLRLGEFCRFLRPNRFALHLLNIFRAGSPALRWITAHTTQNAQQRRASLYGKWLYSEISQYTEGQSVLTLVLSLSGCWYASGDEPSRILLELMRELNISPLPTPDHMMAFVRVTCGYHSRATGAGFYLSTQEQIWLARSLGRMIYALRTSCFFVHDGLITHDFKRFMHAYYDNAVLTIDKLHSIIPLKVNRTDPEFQIPRIFVSHADQRTGENDDMRRFDPLYGDVVEYDELNDLLERMKTEAEIRL